MQVTNEACVELNCTRASEEHNYGEPGCSWRMIRTASGEEIMPNTQA